MASEPHFPSSDLEQGLPASDLLMSVSVLAEVNKAKIRNLAFAASQELEQMALEKEPLWQIDEDNKQTEVLNIIEYRRRFAPLDATLEEVIGAITTKKGTIDLNENADFLTETAQDFYRLRVQSEDPNLKTEASRAVGIVYAAPISLVNMFLNLEHWSSVFSNIVSKASNLGFLSTGEMGNPDGVLQVVKAEVHVPSPLCRTRELCFARYCRQLAPETWIAVDVSMESIFPSLALRCQRKPSGCLIQALDQRSSKVTWVENNVVYNGSIHSMFRHLVTSGLAFRAKRWMTTLERQYERNSILEEQLDQFGAPINEYRLRAGNKSLLKLAERMVRSYNANISSYSENSWRLLPINSEEDILVKTSFNEDDERAPRCVAVTMATSVWLPVPKADNVFNFLCNIDNRNKWDILSHGQRIRQILHIPCGRDTRNQVSLLLLEPTTKKKTEMLYVQETLSDSTGSYVVYAPIDSAALQHIMEGKDPDIVSILPCGFSVLPGKNETTDGSILTIAFEVMDEELSSPKYLPPHSVLTAHTIIRTTIDLIKAATSLS